MSKGTANDFSKLEMYARLDTSFRIITAYQSQSDQVVTRLDVKIGNEQYNVAFISGNPIEPKDGSKIMPEDDLMTPKTGIIDCLNLKVPKLELLRALKELVSDIESNTHTIKGR